MKRKSKGRPDERNPNKMNHHAKCSILKKLYAIHDRAISDFDLSCAKFCDTCCTSHITLTTLEGYLIREALSDDEYRAMISRFKDGNTPAPEMTLNQMATRLSSGQSVPDEQEPDLSGRCDLLSDRSCPLYHLRPFACRAMVSAQKCHETGYADMDPFLFSVNHVIMQYIEHVDATGYFGHFETVLNLFSDDRMRALYEKEQLDTVPDGLIPNHVLTTLMVPPEHRERIQPILKDIYQINTEANEG